MIGMLPRGSQSGSSCCVAQCPQWVESCRSEHQEKRNETRTGTDSNEAGGKHIKCYGGPERYWRLSSAHEKSPIVDFGGLPSAKEVPDEQEAKRGEHNREPHKHRRIPETGGRHSSLLIDGVMSAMVSKTSVGLVAC